MLRDLIIIDLSRLMPGPFSTMLLADLGARVIAVQSPREASDVTATRFPSLLRNKEHVVIDLKQPAGKAIFFRLVSRAHAVVEGFRPGTLKRLGIDHEAARQHNPAIVYASITSYGQSGPDSQRAGHDINFLARSGVLDLMLPEGAEPTIPAVQFADMTGSMMAAMSLLAAVREAERTGRGRHLDVSMADACLSLAVTSLTFRENGWPYRAAESLVGGGLACYRAYRTSDGRLLAVGALEATFFANLCQALERPDLIPHQYDPTRQEDLARQLAETFAGKTFDEWRTFFAGHDACVTGALTFDEALSDPHLARRGALRTAVTPNGRTVPVLGLPLPYPHPDPPGGDVPVRGRDTTRLLHELGFSAEEIAAWLAVGAVVQGD